MFSHKDYAIVYETVLSVPKMEEEMKVTVKLTRRDTLLLSQLIDQGLSDEDLRGIFPNDSFEGLRSFQTELLSQAKFSSDFIENWRRLTSGKVVG
jgi:hypothetical protein